MKQSPSEISEMFNEISPRYDLANRILSFGLDSRWRKKLIAASEPQEFDRVLDLATGTADLVVDYTERSEVLDLVGLDLARGMLEVGLNKTSLNGAHSRPLLVEGDALELPFASGSFDIVTISFGLRNLVDREEGIAEMSRVLSEGGRLLILEFSLPVGRLWRPIYLFYLERLLPVIGGIVAGSRRAYQYLHDSILEFPSPEKIEAMMERAGLRLAARDSFMGGIAVLYKGIKY